MSADPIVQRCILCNTGFTAEQIKGATCCPACGCRAIPLGPESDVTIRINLQELRVLCHWAEFHAKNVDHRELDNPLHQSLNDQVQAMALRIKAQLPPDKPGWAFTMKQDIDAVRAMGLHMTHLVQRGNSVSEEDP